MAVVTKQMVVDAPIERFYEIVVGYEKYPEFVPGIRRCRVKETDGQKQVEYELDLGIRRIKYVLRHEEQRPRKVSWSLVSGAMMKVSSGSWELADDAGRTRATYSVEIQIARPPLVPQSLVDRVADELPRIQLPKTLEAFKARAERRG